MPWVSGLVWGGLGGLGVLGVVCVEVSSLVRQV